MPGGSSSAGRSLRGTGKALLAAALLLHGCKADGCGETSATPRLNIAGIPSTVAVSSLDDSDSRALCVRWESAIRDNTRRNDLRDGCLREALQEAPTDVTACRSAFDECMGLVEEDVPEELDPEAECDGATHDFFAGCTFTVKQLADCVNVTLTDYERTVRESDCASMIAAGGPDYYGNLVDDVAVGAAASACTSIVWDCASGGLRGFAAIESYGDD